MKCPLYFTEAKQNIDYNDAIYLANMIMKTIDYNVDDNFKFNQDIIIFRNENYIVDENTTLKTIRKRKKLTEFTEKLVSEELKKLGYNWKILLPPKNDYSMNNDPPFKILNTLCFQMNIIQDKEMLYYKKFNWNYV